MALLESCEHPSARKGLDTLVDRALGQSVGKMLFLKTKLGAVACSSAGG